MHYPADSSICKLLITYQRNFNVPTVINHEFIENAMLRRMIFFNFYFSFKEVINMCLDKMRCSALRQLC